MPTYIDGDALKDKMQELHDALARDYEGYDSYVTGFGDAITLLENAPAADVQEVKHGKWLYRCYHKMMGHEFECSVCGRWICANSPNRVIEEYPYCHCGAKIDGVEGLEDK